MARIIPITQVAIPSFGDSNNLLIKANENFQNSIKTLGDALGAVRGDILKANDQKLVDYINTAQTPEELRDPNFIEGYNALRDSLGGQYNQDAVAKYYDTRGETLLKRMADQLDYNKSDYAYNTTVGADQYAAAMMSNDPIGALAKLQELDPRYQAGAQVEGQKLALANQKDQQLVDKTGLEVQQLRRSEAAKPMISKLYNGQPLSVEEQAQLNADPALRLYVDQGVQDIQKGNLTNKQLESNIRINEDENRRKEAEFKATEGQRNLQALEGKTAYEMQLAAQKRPVSNNYEQNARAMQNPQFQQRIVQLAPTIQKVADEYDMDPNLIVALIHQENAGKAYGVSPAGAQGIMQIMPNTWKEVAGELKIGAASPNQASVEDQIRAGVYYLRKKLKENDGDIEAALASYNAGFGNVSKAKKKAEAAGDKVWTKYLPKPSETEPYVRDILDKYHYARTGESTWKRSFRPVINEMGQYYDARTGSWQDLPGKAGGASRSAYPASVHYDFDEKGNLVKKVSAGGGSGSGSGSGGGSGGGNVPSEATGLRAGQTPLAAAVWNKIEQLNQDQAFKLAEAKAKLPEKTVSQWQDEARAKYSQPFVKHILYATYESNDGKGPAIKGWNDLTQEEKVYALEQTAATYSDGILIQGGDWWNDDEDKANYQNTLKRHVNEILTARTVGLNAQKKNIFNQAINEEITVAANEGQRITRAEAAVRLGLSDEDMRLMQIQPPKKKATIEATNNLKAAAATVTKPRAKGTVSTDTPLAPNVISRVKKREEIELARQRKLAEERRKRLQM